MKTPNKFYGYLKKDSLLLIKRKKYLYLSISLPIIIALLFLIILNPSNYSIKAGICNLDNSNISNQALTNINGFKLTQLNPKDCLNSLPEEIRKNEYSLGIIIPEGFGKNINNLEQSHIIIVYDNTDLSFSNLLSWKIDQSLEPFERQIIDKINSQIKTNVKSIRSGVDLVKQIPESKYFSNKINEMDSNLQKIEAVKTEFLVNPLWTKHSPLYANKTAKDIGITFVFPIIALFILLMLSSTSIIYDKKTNFLQRMKSSTNPLVYLSAKILFFIFLTILQFILIIILFLIYGAHLNPSIPGTINLLLFIGIINTLMGLIIGLISDNEGIAILFSLIISFPLMLLSGIFSPIETMPTFVQSIAKIMPLTYQINSAKAALLFHQNFSYNWIFSAIIMLGITYWLIRKNN